MKAKITCPECSFIDEAEIVEKTCLAFHKCKKCGKTITPKEDSCCVVCSYSDEKCQVCEEK